MAFFGELYLRSTRPYLSEGVTQQEVQYLVHALNRVASSGPVLDLGCGHGRHACGLQQGLGRPVLGLDLDARSLRERPGDFPAVRGDLRQLPFRTGSASGAFAWYSTLFVFSDDDNRRALAEAARCLQPGGILIFQSVPWERLAAGGPATFEQHLPDGSLLQEESHFDAVTGRDVGRRRMALPDGRTLEGGYAIRYYKTAELQALFESVGLSVTWVHGSLAGEALTPSSAELIIGAERRHV
jgi:SAM-dependent methyltransferase